MSERSKLQTVLIPKTFTLAAAHRWLKLHKYKKTFNGKRADVTEHFYRFRQLKPAKGRYYTMTLENGIQLVYLVNSK